MLQVLMFDRKLCITLNNAPTDIYRTASQAEHKLL